MTPTQRSLKAMRDLGYTCAIVERWCAYSRKRHDLFGFADLMCIHPHMTPVLVQVTSGTNLAARVRKIIAEPRALIAIQSGIGVEVHGWRKLKSNGNRWTIKSRVITEEDFQCSTSHAA